MPEIKNSSDFASSIDWNVQLQLHGRWLRTVIAARTHQLSAVEDVFQELAVAAAKQAEKTAGIQNIKAWLYRVAVTQSLLFRKREGRRRKIIHRYKKQFSDGFGAIESVDPLNWLLADETRLMVRTAIERLAGKDAEILLLKYSEEWSYQQLADHLGISESAVESRLHRAREKLRKELQELSISEVIS